MGNTRPGCRKRNSRKDHPHIHGEYAHCHGLAILRKGSPPHTWGIQYWRAKLIDLIRITPTYMGNTHSAFSTEIIQEDHPHIHGEYGWDCSGFVAYVGSPPHTWGIQRQSRYRRFRQRITPTYMGNTSPLTLMMVQS